MAVLTIVISVFLLRLLNSAVGYANSGNCDSWYFFGLYQDYNKIRDWYPQAYQLFRYPALVPWIYLAGHMSVIWFHDLKFWTYLLIATGSFSFSAIRLLGPIRGWVTSILFSCSTLVLGALSTDYVTGAGLAWQCLVIAATTHGAQSSRWRRWALLVGAFYACCVYTHIPMVMFVFSLPLLFFATYEGEKAIRQFIIFNVWGILGFLAASVALGLYSLSIGNEFLFFRNELVATLNFFNPQTYQRPYSDYVVWFSRDGNIPVIFFGLILSLVSLGGRLTGWLSFVDSRRAVIMTIYAPVAVVCLLWELTGHVILQQNVYAPWIYPTLFMVVGAALPPLSTRNVAMRILLCVAVVGVLIWAATRVDPAYPFVWRYAMCGIFVVAMFTWKFRFAGAASIGAAALLVAMSYPGWMAGGAWSQDHRFERLLYKITQQAHQFVSAHSNDKPPLFWISAEGMTAADPRYASMMIPRSFMECWHLPGSFPSASVEKTGVNPSYMDLSTARNTGYFQPRRMLFVIGGGEDLSDVAKSRLAALGISASAIADQSLAPDMSIAAFEIKEIVDQGNPEVRKGE